MNTQGEQSPEGPTSLQTRAVGVLPLVYPILESLQVRAETNRLAPTEADIDLGQVVVMLTLNRLLAPQPLYKIGEWLGETVLPEVMGVQPAQAYDNRLGRALDRLHPQLGELWSRLVSRAVQVYGLDMNVLHWDITSVYFEGMYEESDWASYGYSRDHRPDTKQVNLQIDVTHDGYVPILYRLLRGNTADISQPLPHLTALLRFLERPELVAGGVRPLLISDCKMITAEAVAACHEQNWFYLGPLADSEAVLTKIGSVSAAELAAHPLAYRPQRVKPGDKHYVPYQGVWQPFRFETNGQSYDDRILVVWSAGKQRLDEQKRKTHLKRLLNQLEAFQKHLNTRRYKQRAYVEQRLESVWRHSPAYGLVDVALEGKDGALRLSFHIKRDPLRQMQALDGRYALATNAVHLSADAALRLFKGQDGVEKRFAEVKGPLQVRPLFVRTDARIEGSVFITLLALLIRSLLERSCHAQGVNLTLKQVYRRFASLQAVDLFWPDGRQQRQLTALTSAQQEVLDALHGSLPDIYASLPESTPSL